MFLLEKSLNVSECTLKSNDPHWFLQYNSVFLLYADNRLICSNEYSSLGILNQMTKLMKHNCKLGASRSMREQPVNNTIFLCLFATLEISNVTWAEEIKYFSDFEIFFIKTPVWDVWGHVEQNWYEFLGKNKKMRTKEDETEKGDSRGESTCFWPARDVWEIVSDKICLKCNVSQLVDTLLLVPRQWGERVCVCVCFSH